MKVTLVVIGALVLLSALVLFLYGFLGLHFSTEIESPAPNHTACNEEANERWCPLQNRCIQMIEDLAC